MGMALLAGRDFPLGDVAHASGPGKSLPTVCIVNEAFARTYFDGRNPVGRWLDISLGDKDPYTLLQIIGYVRNAAYRNLREPIRPTVYVPYGGGSHSTLLARTAGDPLALAPLLRRRVSEARPEFRVRTIQPQSNFVRRHLLRERVLAALSAFFAMVALVLAAIALYGVLHHAVTVRQREIGIRVALGARPVNVVRRVAGAAVGMVCLGLALGSVGGVAAGRVIQALLFEVKATDPEAIAIPVLTLLAAAFIAALPPALRAAGIDPAETLRSE
jgi:hypothetical protein